MLAIFFWPQCLNIRHFETMLMEIFMEILQ